jgi:hypothetical protein
MRAVCSATPSQIASNPTQQQRSTSQTTAPRPSTPKQAAQHNNIMPFTSAVAQAPAAVDALMRPPALEPFSKPPPAVSFLDHRDVFVCDEESTFYSACLQELIFDAEHCSSVIEFGSGDGSPVLNALARSNFGGVINGCVSVCSHLSLYCIQCQRASLEMCVDRASSLTVHRV